jgi:hypothetical protein
MTDVNTKATAGGVLSPASLSTAKQAYMPKSFIGVRVTNSNNGGTLIVHSVLIEYVD